MDELKAVAQAITDAHARIPGLDCEGRIDDARTIIAAFDALIAHRGAQTVAKMKATPKVVPPADVPTVLVPTSIEIESPATATPDVADDATPDAPANVTPIKRGKGKKGS